MHDMVVRDFLVVAGTGRLQVEVVLRADGRLGNLANLGPSQLSLLDLVLRVVDMDEELLMFMVAVVMPLVPLCPSCP